MRAPLVLSLFPGIGLLDRAFEDAGCTVVRGPDVLWGGDVRRFHVTEGRFEGVIGGPPCQPFSPLAAIVRANGFEPRHENLIPEYERIVAEAQPSWWVMEEVAQAPLPSVPGYKVHSQILNNRWCGGTQNRVRRISFGTRDGRPLHVEQVALEQVAWDNAITGGGNSDQSGHILVAGGTKKVKPLNRGPKMALSEVCRLQGLPEDFIAESPFTNQAKRQMIGNGVPLPLGRAIACAVIKTMNERRAA